MLCPSGQYSPSGPGITNCSTCTAGSYCPPQSSAPILCPPGTYSTASASFCTQCPAGSFGAAPGLGSSACSGPCAAGYACPPGSNTSTAIQCGVDSYSTGGAAACIPCPSGLYASGTGLSTSCTDTCPGGYSCPGGSGAPIPCPPGTFSIPSAAGCTVCDLSTPYSPAQSYSSAACTACLSGCDGGLHGALACPSTQWTTWVDGDGVEGVNSCLMTVGGTGGDWATVNATCAAFAGSSSHLLTSRQVGVHALLRLPNIHRARWLLKRASTQ
jgi:hypothetical protein